MESKIKRIDRHKEDSSSQTIRDIWDKFLSHVARMEYEREEPVFKMVYDKHYRPKVFEIMSRTTKRNLRLAGEQATHFPPIKEQAPSEDEEETEELNYLSYLNSLYRKEIVSIYSCVLTIPLARKVIRSKNTGLGVFLAIIIGGCVYTNRYSNKKRERFLETEQVQRIHFRYEDQVNTYFYKTKSKVDKIKL